MASEDYIYDYDMTGKESVPATAQETRKIVRTAQVSLQTKRFDDALDAVSADTSSRTRPSPSVAAREI